MPALRPCRFLRCCRGLQAEASHEAPLKEERVQGSTFLPGWWGQGRAPPARQVSVRSGCGHTARRALTRLGLLGMYPGSRGGRWEVGMKEEFKRGVPVQILKKGLSPQKRTNTVFIISPLFSPNFPHVP